MSLNQSYFDFNTSALYFREKEIEIHRKNLIDIKNRKNKFFSEIEMKAKKEKKICLDSFQVMRQMKEKSRKFKDQQLKYENDSIVKRVNRQSSFFDLKSLDNEYKKHKRLIKSIKKFKPILLNPVKKNITINQSLPPIKKIIKVPSIYIVQPFDKLENKNSRFMNQTSIIF